MCSLGDLNAQTVTMDRSGAEAITADRVTMDRSGARKLDAKSAHLENSGAVFMDAEKEMTFSGEGMASEFQVTVENYIEKRYGAAAVVDV